MRDQPHLMRAVRLFTVATSIAFACELVPRGYNDRWNLGERLLLRIANTWFMGAEKIGHGHGLR
jgi:hypothetical protein